VATAVGTFTKVYIHNINLIIWEAFKWKHGMLRNLLNRVLSASIW